MSATQIAFDVGSIEERRYLNRIETHYQDRKSCVREFIANLITNAYKAISKPKPYEKIRLEELVKERNPKSVLEVGAGNDTTYAGIISNSQVKIYVRSDVSKNQLTQINDKRVESIVYDGIKHPLKDNSMDVVFSKCVLHHIDNGCAEGREKNRIDFLKEQKRLIKDDGRVYCMDVYAPYKNGLKGALWHIVKHRLILGEEEHNFLTTEEAVALFSKAGFEDIRFEEVETYKGKYFVVSGGKKKWKSR